MGGGLQKSGQTRTWGGGVLLNNPDDKNKNTDKSKIAYIFKACWMSKGERGHQIRTMTDKGEGSKKI